MKRQRLKKGQLVKLIEDVGRWSDFVNTEQIGVVLECYNNGESRVLFQDGTIVKLYWFSLEEVDEAT